MDRGYIRITEAGPTEAAQRAALVAAGVDPHYIYVDDVRKPHAGGAADLINRARIEADIRPGSAVIATDLERVGISAVDIVGFVGRVMAKGSAVRVLSSGKVYIGVEAGHLHLDAAEAERVQKSARAAKARAAKVGRSIRTGPAPKLAGEARAAAEADYRDLTQSVRAVAEKHGVSPKTLQRLFGLRDAPAGRRRKPRTE